MVQEQEKKKGMPIVLSAPSGGGKSTIALETLKRSPNIVRSISCTTRPIRPNEKDGVDYFFLKEEAFKKKIDAGEFLEWAFVHDQYYGTPESYVTEQLEKGKDVMMVIDPQGAASVRKIYPNGTYVFIVPSRWDVLRERLESRGLDDVSSIEIRMADAKIELRSLKHYDYIVVNEDLEEAIADVMAILRSENLKVVRTDKKDIPILR